MQDACFVCEKHQGQVSVPGGLLYDDGIVALSHQALEDGRPESYPGVLFVEPRRHVPSMGSLTSNEAMRVGLICTVASDVLGSQPNVERVYLATFGHGVDHLHIWLIPRYKGTPDNLFGAAVLAWKGAPKFNEEQLASIAKRLGQQVREHSFLQSI